MKPIYFIGLFMFLIGICANAQDIANPFEEESFFEIANQQTGVTSVAVDTANVRILSSRFPQDSLLYVYQDDFNYTIIFLDLIDSVWVKEGESIRRLNEDRLWVEWTNCNIGEDSICNPTTRSLREFNEDQQLTSFLEQVYEDDQWVNINRITRTYNNQGLQTYFAEENWENNQWNFYEEQTQDFDENGKLISKERILHSTNGQFRSRFIYAYNDFNLITSITRQNLLEEEWVLQSITYYTYNENNLLFQEERNDDILTNYLITYDYDSLGNNTHILRERIEDDVYVNEEQTWYEYDEFNYVILKLEQEWENNTWENSTKVLSVNDEFGNRIQVHSQYWNEAWINSSYFTATYNELGKQNYYEVLLEWNQETEEYEIGERAETNYLDYVDLKGNALLVSKQFYYRNTQTVDWTPGFYFINYYGDETLLGISSMNPAFNTLSIYPNPTQGIFQLAVDDVFKNDGVLEVFNLNGQLILRQNILASPQISVDLRAVSNGLYVVKLINGVQQATSLLQVK